MKVPFSEQKEYVLSMIEGIKKEQAIKNSQFHDLEKLLSVHESILQSLETLILMEKLIKNK